MKAESIPLVDSDNFKTWSGYSYLTLGRIFRLTRILQNYSIILSEGDIDIRFLEEGEKYDISANVIYINVKNLFSGKVDLTIGEIIFNLIIKTSLDPRNYNKILTEKFSVSDLTVTKEQQTLFNGSLIDFLDTNVVIDTKNVTAIQTSNGPIFSGRLRTISDLPKEEKNISSNAQALLSMMNQSSDFSESFASVIKLTSYLIFLKKFFTVGDTLMKYCKTYIDEVVKSKCGDGILEDLIKVFILQEKSQNDVVRKFLADTKLSNIQNKSEEALIEIVYEYFEDILNSQIQEIINQVPSVTNFISSSLEEALSSTQEMVIMNKQTLSNYNVLTKNNMFKLLFAKHGVV